MSRTENFNAQTAAPIKRTEMGWKIATILAASVLPAIVMLSFSPSIISANAHEIAFNRRALYVVWALFLLFSTIFAIAALWRPKFLIVLTTWAIAVLIWNGLFPHVWLNSPIKIATAVVAEFALVGALFFILSRLPLVAVTSAGAIFTVMTVVASAPQHYKLLTTLPGKHDQVTSAHRKDLLPPESITANIEGNVYHVVMDAFSAPYITHWLSREEKTSLEGFTFYPSAIASYGWTNLSMRAVFSGKLHAEPNSDWEGAFSNGFSSRLRQAGISMQYFPYYRFYCDPAASICRATEDLYEFYRKNIGITFVLDVAFQSGLPLSLRNYLLSSLRHQQRPVDAWDYGFSISVWLRSVVEGGEAFPKWRQPFQTLTMDTLDDFLSTEEKLPDRGRYVYLHMMVPHPPWAYDSDCTFAHPDRQAEKEIVRALDEQYACAMTVIEKIVKKLRELDRFDNSMVIFHADHGAAGLEAHLNRWDEKFIWNADAKIVDRSQGNFESLPSHHIEALAGILFFVHLPDQKNFEVSKFSPHLVDLAPTILDFFGLDASDLAGVSLLTHPAPTDRQDIFYETSTNRLGDIEKFGKFVRQGNAWELIEVESSK